MTTTLSGVAISPVNMEERKTLGIKAGDTVRVHQKIQDKGKTRIQVFEGVVLARKHGDEPGATFTVRKVSSGIGVEKIYPLYSPNIDKIEIVKRAHVRRAKLYYIREKVAREIKRQMRRMSLVSLGTESEMEAAAKAAAAAEAQALAAAKIAEEEAVAQAQKAAQEAEEAALKAAAEAPVVEETTEVVAEANEESPAEEKKD
jgi:large subunit ribosomal protein L19